MATKAVLVTGASTGIGEAVALRLARAGWLVFGGVRKDEDGERLVQQSGGRIVPVALDVTSDDDIASAAEAVRERTGGGLYGLVNNAGVARGGPIEVLPMHEWRDQFETNVFGQVAVTKTFLPLIRQATGRIIFISSVAGLAATPMVGPYTASKHALEAIGESLSEELRPWGIKVVLVEPGVIRTPIWDKARATGIELEETVSPDGLALYRGQIDGIKAGVEANARRGILPEKVAAVVERALTAERPKLRYTVGLDAKAVVALTRVLPDRVRVPLFRRLKG